MTVTKEQALHSFYSSFGLTAYEENTIPTGENKPKLPYITYNVVTDSFDKEVALALNVWYRGTSWLPCNEKTEEISAKIGYGGIILPCEGGRIWLKRGSPFAQNMSDPSDDLIKRKYINITAEFFTVN